MATYRELIYIILDEMKLASDDSYITEDHVLFLLSKFRSFVLKQQYENKNRIIPESNYQELCINLEEVPAIPEDSCEGGVYLKSTEKLPNTIIGSIRVTNADNLSNTITYVSKERMPYVGNNKWLQNIIYATRGTDNYLYLKSKNPQYLYLEKVKVFGIFEDTNKTFELLCSKKDFCDPWDLTFPLEDGLIPMVIEMVLKELVIVNTRPEDKDNDSNDGVEEIQGNRQAMANAQYKRMA